MPTPRFRTVGNILQACVVGSWVAVSAGSGAGMSIHGNSWHDTTFVTSSQNWSADSITSGTLDGDRLPNPSAAKKGGVPATGTPAGKFLKDDGTWATAGGGNPSSSVAYETSFGVSPTAGASNDYSRGDHTHGTPANPVTEHEALTTTAHGGILLINGLTKITVGTQQPSTPSTGDLWIDTN